jgi:hypothetical protein
MSPRTALRLLWAAAVLMLPVPFFLAETGLVPPARIFMLAFITLAVILAEGAQGVAGLSAAFLFAQALGYGALLWLAALLASRVVALLGRRALAVVTLGMLLGGATLATGWNLYRDPFRAHSLHVNLLHVYE